MVLVLFNSLRHKKERFTPLKKGRVGLYTCGPTVYQYAHIGNLRTYVFEDVLKRTLMLGGYKVTHIMNITDVGHLVSDEDTGEDKVEREASRTGKSAWDIARFYEDAFFTDLHALNIIPPNKTPRATECIDIQIRLIQKLEKKGYTYRTSDGIYFDTSRFKEYGALAKKNISGIKAGARVKEGEKRHPTDFALWKFSPAHEKRQMEWDSPWGKGFPGWHIECSAMSMKYLGNTFDIHCGGIDHIQVHHQNEIAQSEAVTGKPLAHYWLHGNFLRIEDAAGGDEKMSKSLGNVITLETLRKKGFDPLDFRYLMLGTHWRKPTAFNWTALESARTARRELVAFMQRLGKEASPTKKGGDPYQSYKKDAEAALADDLNTPKFLSIVWKFVKAYRASKHPSPFWARETMLWFDHILGLDLKDALAQQSIPKEVTTLIEKRELARDKKDWKKADELRNTIASLGWSVEDTKSGPDVKKL